MKVLFLRWCIVLLFAIVLCGPCHGWGNDAPQELGGPLRGRTTLVPLDRPYEVKSDVYLEGNATLVVRPGVEVRFAPGTGIIVRRNGILIAEGEPGQRIVFTRLLQQPSYWPEPEEGASSWPSIRLVEGESILEGRLHMFYNAKWRSVCTNSKNWTEEDLQVVCRQLGFSGGVLYRWFPRQNNDTSQMLLEAPRCDGYESELSLCTNWRDKQIGSGVCDYHEDIGIRCDGNLGNHSSYHWRGLQFVNAKDEYRRPIVNKANLRLSSSILRHVDILYAGSDDEGNVTAAVDVEGVPPQMYSIDIKFSAYDGIRLYDPPDAYTLQDSVIAENRGYGIFVNSSVSQITLSGCTIRDNGGDGVHFIHHENFLAAPPFCGTGNIRDEQTYPVRRSLIQHKNTYVRECDQMFEVASWTGQVLTVNFLGFTSSAVDKRHVSHILVYDGPTESSRLLASVPIFNNTYPQSITSTKQKILLKYRPVRNEYVAFTIEILANPGRAYDLNVTDCTITANNGRGIVIKDQRSGILVNRTRLVANGYSAGLDISGGSGNIMVNNSFVTTTEGDGINITTAGGYLHIDRTSVANNTGRGISFWFNETSTSVAFNHSVHLTRSEFIHNGLYGILIGNQCRPDSFFNVSLNVFKGNGESGLVFMSCWQTQLVVGQATFFVTNNEFENSNHLALEFSPVHHAQILIEHNMFRYHKRGVLLVSARPDVDDFINVPAKVDIVDNFFLHNTGTFVANVGLFPGSLMQHLTFSKNHLSDNMISEPFASLVPRSRVAAVVTVTSENADIFRNFFNNTQSKYEVGSHFERHDVTINATFNFWGPTKPREVYEKVFDRKDRYNLARVEFLPFLLRGSNLEETDSVSDIHERDKIIPFKSLVDGLTTEIGGEVSGYQILSPGTYRVRRDIYIRRGGKLEVQSGATLKFDKSVGMMVQGTLLSESNSPEDPIIFALLKGAERGSASSKIRLSNGTEGRLEVSINGKWGPICDYGWDIVDAAITCHQMGLVLHPEDWLLEQSEFSHRLERRFALSNLQCTFLDTDITFCKSERDFENSCSTEVGLRCHPPSWSGIRLGMAAEESRLKNVIVEHAGLFDYSTNQFKPALQVDYNRHIMSNLVIRQNTDSGLGIMWSEMFLPENRQVTDSHFLNNQRHGIVAHAQGLDIIRCDIRDNKESGVHYNPTFTKAMQRDLITWVDLNDRSSQVVMLDNVPQNLQLGFGQQQYLLFSKNKLKRKFTITTDPGRSLGIMILNPFDEGSSENMKIYGRLEITEGVDSWDLRDNLTSFPLRTPGYAVLVNYDSGHTPSGEGIIFISSVDGQRTRSAMEHHPTLRVQSTTIKNCGRGFSSHHFNRDIGIYGDHFHRYSNETILITDTTITGSKFEAIFVWTPFWDPIIKNLAEVNYTILRSEIRENARGLLHYSRDIRNSNNLFHWTINETVITYNANGGIDIRLPYVWQYSENFTHSFTMHDSILSHNQNFRFSIDGHFARVNMSHNVFKENVCEKGVVSISGMEKEMLIEDNLIRNNSAQFAVEFNMESHADKFGLISATFYRNVVEDNRDIRKRSKFNYHPANYAVSIRGVQPVNITRNIIENINFQFELLAGVLTGSVANTINVARNWWGSNIDADIENRIFDFNDWNGYALATFSPFLGVKNRDGGTLTADEKGHPFRPDGLLGGRVFENVRLSRRYSPYTVASDLTIMPDTVLTIDPGVVLEFYPSVGILALGDIVAQGRLNDPIIMRPAKMSDGIRFRRHTLIPKSRFCVNEKCNAVRSDGFLEIFNSTTEQWVPVCDSRFTERNAQAVCNELGYSTLNVHIMRGPRLDMGPTQVGRIRAWPHPYECLGTEKRLSECEYRLNGYVDDYRCQHTDDFVYIYCGPEILESGYEHWGGIRFSIPGFEVSNRPTINYALPSTSKMEYVRIEGAGVLHGEKSSAIQLVQREVHLDYINVTQSAFDGIEVIAVPRSLSFNELVLKDNLATGLSFLSLTGESSDGNKLAYDPLLDVDLPYGVFGLVDMCDINKEMIVENRILLYYKYDNKPVDCIKLFSSSYHLKQIGFRLLQFNLFDGKNFSAQPDRITIYDGDIFNSSSPELGRISWQYGPANASKFYISSGSTLSVNLHTIGGGGDKGFIAEVVTLRISHPIARDTQHNVSYSEITGNGKEGITYRSAGEITPAITIRHSRIVNNGRELFGNFTVGQSAVFLDIQNTQRLYFYNNLVMGNQGGLHLHVDSHTSLSSLRGLIVNNLFTENLNREALVVQGRKSGAFQFVDIYRNYFARNYAEYKDTIILSQVVSNVTQNVGYNNTGKHFLDVQGFERMPLSYQTCQNNSFWKNVATDYWDRSTIVASKAGQRFNYNYLVNPDNDFELAAMNRSKSERLDMREMREAPVDATSNWWGFNTTAAISGRIKDYLDFEELLEVRYSPFLYDNSTVLSGKCAGGWTKIKDTCFLYVGGIMTFAEAKRFCELDNASMPYVKTMHHDLMAFVEQQQYHYHRYSDRIWIQSIDVPLRECAVLVNRKVKVHSCREYFPFLCERDPEITVTARFWIMEPVTIAFISITLLAFIFVVMCLIFWLCKSRQRYREKLERRNSIRASIRSNRSLTGFSELGYKRRIERAFEAETTSSKVQDLRLNGSVDSIEKTPSRFSCSMDDSYENTVGDTSTVRVGQNGHFTDFVNRYRQDPELENTTVNMMVHPTFDLTYENQGYIDRSASRNSHEVSRDWSSTTGSTLDMKRSLDHDVKEEAPQYHKEEVPQYHNNPYRNIPTPHLTSSRESNSRDGGSSCSSGRVPPLETAM